MKGTFFNYERSDSKKYLGERKKLCKEFWNKNRKLHKQIKESVTDTEDLVNNSMWSFMIALEKELKQRLAPVDFKLTLNGTDEFSITYNNTIIGFEVKTDDVRMWHTLDGSISLTKDREYITIINMLDNATNRGFVETILEMFNKYKETHGKLQELLWDRTNSLQYPIVDNYGTLNPYLKQFEKFIKPLE